MPKYVVVHTVPVYVEVDTDKGTIPRVTVAAEEISTPLSVLQRVRKQGRFSSYQHVRGAPRREAINTEAEADDPDWTIRY